MTIIESDRLTEEKFDQFCSANSFESILNNFNELCDLAVTTPTKHPWNIYQELSRHLKPYWKASALFSKLEKRVQHKEYRQQSLCRDINALVIGSGPCGLRCAIELALLGARVVIVEKRDSFSRFNVLHLWPYLIDDLKALGAKTFFGKFCAGSIDHVSIKTLQCILLKVALLFGVQVFPGVSYDGLVEPEPTPENKFKSRTVNGSSPESGFVRRSSPVRGSLGKPNGNPKSPNSRTNSTERCALVYEQRIEKVRHKGWGVRLTPSVEALKRYKFDVLIGADGKRSCLGFPTKELRCRLAIAITANFINYHTPSEAQVEEISGMARIFNQAFFARLAKDTQIDLENIVYYKDETHYFVMTAKKHSLLAKGVLRKDQDDSETLLSESNVDRVALQAYARELANYVTNGAIPHLDFARNARDEPDVDVFDFTHLFAAQHSCQIIEKHQCFLLQCLIGDGLYEPFWPTGSGCALGFLSALDAAWAVSRMASGINPLQVIAERESVYQHLSHTTPQNMPSNFAEYTLDPMTRYTRCDLNLINPTQVKYLYKTNYDCSTKNSSSQDNSTNNSTPTTTTTTIKVNQKSNDFGSKFWNCEEHFEKRDYLNQPNDTSLIRWLQVRLSLYQTIGLIDPIKDLTPRIWSSGRNLMCLIHRYCPELVPELDDLVMSENPIDKNHSWFKSDETCLERACTILANCFHIQLMKTMSTNYSNGVNQKTINCPKTQTEWLTYLYQICVAFCQIKTPGPKCIFATNSETSSSQTRSPMKFKATGMKSNITPRPNKPDLLANAKMSNGFGVTTTTRREISNGSVQKGLIVKRRKELVARLSRQTSVKRKLPSKICRRSSQSGSNSLGREGDDDDDDGDVNVISIDTPCRDYDAERDSRQDGRDEDDEELAPKSGRRRAEAPSPVRIPDSVARLFAPPNGSSFCYVCHKRLYQLGRIMAHGFFFHRDCFRCSVCNCQLQPDTSKCIQPNRPNEGTYFYCLSHAPEQQIDPPRSPARKQDGYSEASLTSRLQAGQFPFGPASYEPQLVKKTIPSKLDRSPTRSSGRIIKSTIPPSNANYQPVSSNYQNPVLNRHAQTRSALLAGLGDSSDETMGIGNVTQIRSGYYHRDHQHHHQHHNQHHYHHHNNNNHHHYDNNSSSNNYHQHHHQQQSQQQQQQPLSSSGPQSHRQRRKQTRATSPIGTSGDIRIIRLHPLNKHSVGIRDDPAPGPDCYLSGHLGLPEVARRTNLELNTSNIWSESVLEDIIDHMRVIRPRLIAAEDYFASSESETTTLSDKQSTYITNPQQPSNNKSRPRIASPNVTSYTRKSKEIQASIRSEKSDESDSSSPTLQNSSAPKHMELIIHSDNHRPLEPSASDPSISPGYQAEPSAIPPPFSSPAHQSRLAAKQRFCMEPPKPITIDPLRFISSRNRERAIQGALQDCAEQVELVQSPTILRASVWPVNGETVLPSVRSVNPIKEDSHRVLAAEYGHEQSALRHNLEDATTASNLSTDDCPPRWHDIGTSHADSEDKTPFSVLDDIKAIDSISDSGQSHKDTPTPRPRTASLERQQPRLVRSYDEEYPSRTREYSHAHSMQSLQRISQPNRSPRTKPFIRRAKMDSDLEADSFSSSRASVDEKKEVQLFVRLQRAPSAEPYTNNRPVLEYTLKDERLYSSFDNLHHSSSVATDTSSTDLDSQLIIRPKTNKISIKSESKSNTNGTPYIGSAGPTYLLSVPRRKSERLEIITASNNIVKQSDPVNPPVQKTISIDLPANSSGSIQIQNEFNSNQSLYEALGSDYELPVLTGPSNSQ